MECRVVSYIEFLCNYDCDARIPVDVSDWGQFSKDGFTPASALYPWLGRRVLMALLQHHRECMEFNRRSDGRPDLRLVLGGPR